jgi:hypothetical protein
LVAMMIQPTTQVSLIFVRVKSLFSEAIFT